MEAREQGVVLILADISGYTKFMVANQTAAVHGQVIITLLIETILAEVDIPLTLHGIEGDAVFLSAAHPSEEAAWREVLAQVRTKLARFFEVFLAAIVRAAETTPCDCPSCGNVDKLKLKIIVHSGRAVFHTIAGLAQVSGTDVIIAHRLLKNSVPSGEYLLMTDSAYQDLGVAETNRLRSRLRAAKSFHGSVQAVRDAQASARQACGPRARGLTRPRDDLSRQILSWPSRGPQVRFAAAKSQLTR